MSRPTDIAVAPELPPGSVDFNTVHEQAVAGRSAADLPTEAPPENEPHSEPLKKKDKANG